MNKRELIYHRPQSREELNTILTENPGRFAFLSGGDFERQFPDEIDHLVDLQALNLDLIREEDQTYQIGGLVALAQFDQVLEKYGDFHQAISIESGLNVQNSLSIGNFLSHADGRSPLLVSLRALHPSLHFQPSDLELTLEDALTLKEFSSIDYLEGLFFEVPKAFAFESVARTPKDKPILCISACLSAAGLITISVGGTSAHLPLIELRNFEETGLAQLKEILAGTDDEWASSEYRQDVGAVLLSRCLQRLNQGLIQRGKNEN